MNHLKTIAAAAAILGATATAAHAGTVNLSDWAVKTGSWNRIVDVKNVSPGNPTFARSVYAGGFSGSAFGFTGADDWVNTSSLLTYCVEFTQSFSLPSSNMGNYNLVSGASYTHWGQAGANPAAARLAIAARLGGLMTHVSTLNGAAAIDTREESAAVQLAIWEIIYETPVGEDLNLNDGNLKENRSGATNASVRTQANQLLGDSAATASDFDVYVLSKEGSQDFIALREKEGPPDEVPEPGAMSLSLAALGAMGFALRRRRRS
jgi:hypothetical protein